MTRSSTYLTKNLLLILAAGLALSCGGGDGGGPTVDSQLLGIYRITSYQGSTVGCEQPSDLDPPSVFVLLYSFLPNDDPDEPLLGGVFCSAVESCRAFAQAAPEPTIGYSFIQGDDAGWRGWGISNSGAANDQCRADVQAHVLTSANMDDINIETKTFATVFDGVEPTPGSTELVCRNIDAINTLGDDPPPPCTEILVLDATFEAGI